MSYNGNQEKYAISYIIKHKSTTIMHMEISLYVFQVIPFYSISAMAAGNSFGKCSTVIIFVLLKLKQLMNFVA